MTAPSYRPWHHGPTLLYIFQGYVRAGATSQEATTRLTGEIETGVIETSPQLKPGWRLRPTKGKRLPCLVTDVVNRRRVASKTKFREGLPRLEVIDAKGIRTGAEKYYARECTALRVPPRPAAEPVAPEILQQLVAALAVRPTPEKPSASLSPSPAPSVPAKSKLEEKLGKPVVVQLRPGEDAVWLEITPHLQTLYDADKLSNESVARRAVRDLLRTKKHSLRRGPRCWSRTSRWRPHRRRQATADRSDRVGTVLHVARGGWP